MPQRDLSEVEHDNGCGEDFMEKVRESNAACESGDYPRAIQLYTEALRHYPNNHILYSNRSAALLKTGRFTEALQDATRSRQINPNWPKAHYREGVALQCLGRHGDALAVFSTGLSIEPNSTQLLGGLIEASIKSPLKSVLEPTFEQLNSINHNGLTLDKSPFLVMSVIGQELLAAGQYSVAVVVLESALRIGTSSPKLRGSVFSALSSAYWALNSLDKAIGYMQQDLLVAKSLKDVAGESRAHGNLGSAYFSKGSFKEALTAHRYQLVFAMKAREMKSAASALTSLGHVYTAIGDYPNALASHKQCVQLVKQTGEVLQEAREIGNVGAVYLAMGEFESALDCHMQHLKLSKKLGNKVEEARAYSNLGSSYHYRRHFSQAISYHENVLRLAQELGDKVIEARAYAGLGHAARCAGNYAQAKHWHEKQLDMALNTHDKVGEGRACSNLGIVYQLLGAHESALKLHHAHLNIAKSLHDRAAMGRAFGNIGNAYSAMGYYEQAIKYHKQELTISKEVKDRSAEASTHGNLAVAYQSLGAFDMALLHYRAHLNIARDLKDTAGEACALLNLANCLSTRNDFTEAIPYYENYLMLSQELHDIEGEAKACHFLGYAHYCLGNYREAVRYYDQDLSLAKDLHDRMNMARAYCNLGLAHLALGNLETSLECQKYFLAISHMTKSIQAKLRALGNIGDILMKMNNTEEAHKMYHRQLTLARQVRDLNMEAAACSSLGLANRYIKCHDKALSYHCQELALRQEMNDLKGECCAHGHLGAVNMSLRNYKNAIKCYQLQLERSKELRDNSIEAEAYGNLGIARMNMGIYEGAIGYFEQQLATLEQLSTHTSLTDKGRAFGNLGDCYDALGDFDEAIKCHEQFLTIAVQLQNVRDLEKAYTCLGQSYRRIGYLDQSLVCFEKILVIAHELSNSEMKASIYGELGSNHIMMGNYQQAVSCFHNQISIARELNNRVVEANSASSLGYAHQLLGQNSIALHYHKLDLEIGKELSQPLLQCRAYGNIGNVEELLGNLNEAIKYQEEHLSIASQIDDKTAKAAAYGSLGSLHHTLGHTSQAVIYLTQALQSVDMKGKSDKEGHIRFKLGMALLADEQSDAARGHLDQAAELLDNALNKATHENFQSIANLRHQCYQALQTVLVQLNRCEEALLVTEKYRIRGKTAMCNSQMKSTSDCHKISSVEGLLDIVNKQKASVLYFSLASGYLFSWLIVPNKGIVKFHETLIQTENGTDNLLMQYLNDLKNTLTVQPIIDTELSESCHLDELEDKLTKDNERSYLRMVNRNHLYNSSNYSLSSLFSVGSVGGSTIGSVSRPGSVRAKKTKSWLIPDSLNKLYELLIAPFEDFLFVSCASHNKGCSGRKELLLVLEEDLMLVPFSMLHPKMDNECLLTGEYLAEKFCLLVTSSLMKFKENQRALKKSIANDSTNMTTLVVGNPRLPEYIHEQLCLSEVPHTEQEANMVAEMLQTKPFVREQANKQNILDQLVKAECIHLATHVSWELSAIILSPDENENNLHAEVNISEVLLTVEDLLSLKLNARLVVLSWSHSRDDWASAKGLSDLTNGLLMAGAQCILIPLWPVPSTAAKILLRAFYSALLQGSRVCRALCDAMQTVQHTKHFSHPSNWAGYFLFGSDVRLSSKVALMGQALCEIIKTPDRCRDALRVTLHLVEKSLQRIHRGQKNAMYTTQKSIENKVGDVCGWKELLQSVGFRFEPAANGIPSSVFFPQSDPEDRLTQCSASLQALLGLNSVTLNAMSKLISTSEITDDVMAVVRHVSEQLNSRLLSENEQPVDMSVNVKLWHTPGCHELLASLGFDLIEVGSEEVTLRTGKQGNKRSVQFVLQALLTLFDTQEVPKSLSMCSSSSLESVVTVEDDRPNDIAIKPCPASAFQVSGISGSGAFTSYVRKRGEPDGRTASDASAQITKTTGGALVMPTILCRRSGGTNGGGESDAAFTPSPPVSGLGDALSITLAHQTKIRNLYSTPARPDSSSSASSATDWEGNGHSTILRRGNYSLPPIAPIKKLHPSSEILDDIVVESDVIQTDDTEKMSLYLAQVMDMSKNEPGKALSNIEVNNDIQDPIRSSQLRQLNYDPKPTISEVYLERKIGLGLAPSLLKLLSLDKNLANENKTTWLSPSMLKRFGSDVTQETPVYGELNKRDEGDGRSIAESQSSTGSYKKRTDTNTLRNFESLIEEENSVKEPKIRFKKKSYAPPPSPGTSSLKPIIDS
ncbi:tetratricopeptide repeat protein 28 isoform X2 [Adelges cooleyi]|uniref:tetratricopeptide repeat protein 28 isoform X2 n=1 Tax=Adelges cooleyi TaxID=133065 RepID=UPI00217FE6AA|nr:tetratricopeptide repeat protein 28 isoform X2 [Adelges cooleyi]